MRLERSLVHRLDAICTALRAPGALSLDELAAELRQALGADRAAVFSFRAVADDRVQLAMFHASGVPRSTPGALDQALAIDPCWAYHPLRPAAQDRDRAVVFRSREVEPLRERIPALDRLLATDPWVSDDHQIRFLVCDGPDLLAWFGGFRGGRSGFGEREAAVLRRIAPALRDRLRLERDVARGRLAFAALPAALEEVAAPAFLVSARGDVLHANGAGAAQLASPGGRDVRAWLATRGHPAYRWTELRAPGLQPHFLVVAHRPPSRHAERAAACARQWGLTPRQAEVLAALARGASNKVAAAELGCGEPTVEFHVTALLAKAGCESRAALVARFWSEG
jgi:DNA-binding CsgD family transcriptional regulator